MSSSSVTQTKTNQQHTMKSRKPRNQIKNHHKPISEMDQQIQTTRCNSTISSLLLSTLSNETAVSQQPTSKKINFLSAAASFRGLGCTAGASQQVSVPAVIRASADWTHQGKKTRKKKHRRNIAGGSSKNSVNDGSSATCVDFQDVWCGPGIDAAASVDCVVSKKNVSSRAKIDLEKITHREPSSSYRRRTTTVYPESFTFPDMDPDIFTACSFGTATYPRHIRDLSSDDLSEIMMLQGRILMGGGRYNSRDLFRDLRLDVDNMSYEQLLELGERIGHVNTGLKQDEMEPHIRKTKLQFSDVESNHQVDKKCSICQEEFEEDDEVGRLKCDHLYHIECIQQWVAHKNFCPVCKEQVAARH